MARFKSPVRPVVGIIYLIFLIDNEIHIVEHYLIRCIIFFLEKKI